MIDTVVLRIPWVDFTIARHDLFAPNAYGLFNPPYLPFADQPYIKCVQNASKQDEALKIYKPRLTLYKHIVKGGFSMSLHIEFSIPKLLFGNNFDEITTQDFSRVIQVLHEKLLKMGVLIKPAALWQAQVHVAHFSKNIAFTDGTTVSLILDRMYKAKVHGRFDLNTVDYRNGGELLRYHTKAFSMVLYDKIAELRYSKARAIEKKDRLYNPHPELFAAVRKKIPLEVLRLEIRVCERRKLAKLSSLPVKELTFENILHQELAQQILLQHWQGIYEQLKVVLLQEMDVLEQLEYIAKQKPQARAQKLFALVGVSEIIKKYGYRDLQKRIKYNASPRTLARLYGDLQSVSFHINNRSLPFKTLTEQIENYSPLTLKQFDL